MLTKLLVGAVLLLSAGTPVGLAQTIALPPLPTQPAERALVEHWRARQREVLGIEARFRGSLEGAPLGDLGKVAFILEQARGLPRRLLHPYDHDLVFSAVEGQPAHELEANLPAIVNYIRLTLASKLYLSSARAKQPLVGSREGMPTIISIAKAVHNFRSQQVAKVRAGGIQPPQVLTKANLGGFGEAATLQKLKTAHDEGHQQFMTQRNLVGVAALVLELQLALVLALFIRRKTGNTYLFLHRRVAAETPRSPGT